MHMISFIYGPYGRHDKTSQHFYLQNIDWIILKLDMF